MIIPKLSLFYFLSIIVICGLWRTKVLSLHCPRRIRRRKKPCLVMKSFGTFMYVWKQFCPCCVANIGKDTVGAHKAQLCAKASFSLLLILLVSYLVSTLQSGLPRDDAAAGLIIWPSPHKEVAAGDEMRWSPSQVRGLTSQLRGGPSPSPYLPRSSA